MKVDYWPQTLLLPLNKSFHLLNSDSSWFQFDCTWATTEQNRVGIEIQASGCMLCFIDVLVVTLLGLAEPTNVGDTASVLAVIGLVYALAALRSLQVVTKNWKDNISQLGFLATFTILFAFQLYDGVHISLRNLKPTAELRDFSVLPIIILVVGVARTWQLISMRDTGMVNSLKVLIKSRKK